MLELKNIKNWEQVVKDMTSINQFRSMSVLEHGLDVAKWYLRVKDAIMLKEKIGDTIKTDDIFITDFVLPNWCREFRVELIRNQLPEKLILESNKYHDCGKPYCHIIDDEGQSHFPDHANVSYKVFMGHYPAINDLTRKIIGELIRDDMHFHTMKAVNVEEYVKTYLLFNKKSHLASRLLITLAEIYSNANHLQKISLTEDKVINSTNFKIKAKHIKSRGNQICKLIFSE